MNDDTALVLRGTSEIELGTLRADTPTALLSAASAIATPLAAMIEKQGLANSIQGRQYVRCEGWTTMGAMLGVVPQEVSNIADSLGVYVATVELVNIKTGAIVGRASAECGAPDELDRKGNPLWANRPAYARRSMAATRATSKAFRQSFSWIMVLAGFQATPAEEIPDEGFADAPRPAAKPPVVRDGEYFEYIFTFGKHKGDSVKTVPTDYIEWLVKGYVKDIEDKAKAEYKESNKSMLAIMVAEIRRRKENAQEAAVEAPFK